MLKSAYFPGKEKIGKAYPPSLTLSHYSLHRFHNTRANTSTENPFCLVQIW